MSTEIYYFSGTGNSFIVAKSIAEKIDSKLIPVADFLHSKEIKLEAEVVGIVFPVYYGELPIIIKEFAKKLQNLNNKYIFAVCTYGGAAMASIRTLKRIVKANGGELSAAYGVQMPQNSFYKPREDCQKLFSKMQKRVELIEGNTRRRAKGIFYTNHMLEIVMMPIQAVVINPVCKKAFVKQTRLPANSSMDQLVRFMDIGLYTNEKCNGCGICSRLCPVNNIEIVDRKPVWLHHCETCLACYNWCPNKAIQGGITPKNHYYHHPDINISDMLR